MTTPTFQDTNHVQMAANARLNEAEALSILSAEDLDEASGMFTTTSGVTYRLHALRDAGLLTFEDGKARTIVLRGYQ